MELFHREKVNSNRDMYVKENLNSREREIKSEVCFFRIFIKNIYKQVVKNVRKIWFSPSRTVGTFLFLPFSRGRVNDEAGTH